MSVKEGPPDERIFPTNLEREIYEIQIRDIQNCINRLESRYDDLLRILETTKREIEDNDMNTSNGIAQINQELFGELAKIDNWKSAIEILEKRRLEDKQTHDSNIDTSNKQYNATLRALVSKIKKLNAKVNSLENYKNKREVLRKRLETCDQFMIDKEIEVEHKFQKIDLQLKIDKAELINDLQNQIFQRALEFEKKNFKNTSVFVHNLFQNNIFMRNEIKEIAIKISQEEENCQERDEITNFNRARTRDGHSSMMRALEISQFQRGLSKVLKEKYEKFSVNRLHDNAPLEETYRNYDVLLENLKSQVHNSEESHARARKLLHQRNAKLSSAKHKQEQTSKKIVSSIEILYDVKYAIACVLELPIISDFKLEETEKNFKKMSKSEYLLYLLSLFMKQ